MHFPHRALLLKALLEKIRKPWHDYLSSLLLGVVFFDNYRKMTKVSAHL
jgi:hypothetical protein